MLARRRKEYDKRKMALLRDNSKLNALLTLELLAASFYSIGYSSKSNYLLCFGCRFGSLCRLLVLLSPAVNGRGDSTF